MRSGVSLPSAVANRQQLDACGLLRRPALVGVDVRRLCADDRSPAGQHREQTDDVGAGAVEHREGLHTRTEVLCAHLLQSGCVDVLAVGDLVSVVGVGDRREHLGVHTRVVVGGEAADAWCRAMGSRLQSGPTKNIGKHPIPPRPVSP